MYENHVWRVVRRVTSQMPTFCASCLFVFVFAFATLSDPRSAEAQSYRFNSVSIEGNQRVDPATIITYAGIARGQTVSAGELNDAYQRILACTDYVSGMTDRYCVELFQRLSGRA